MEYRLKFILTKWLDQWVEFLCLMIIRDRDRITLIIYHRIESEFCDNISHFCKTEILSVELPIITVIYFLDMSFSLCEYTSATIIEIDLPLYLIHIWMNGNSLEYIFPSAIFLCINRGMRKISSDLICSMVHTRIISAIYMVPIDWSRTKDKIVEFWEKDVVRWVHKKKSPTKSVADFFEESQKTIRIFLPCIASWPYERKIWEAFPSTFLYLWARDPIPHRKQISQYLLDRYWPEYARS